MVSRLNQESWKATSPTQKRCRSMCSSIRLATPRRTCAAVHIWAMGIHSLENRFSDAGFCHQLIGHFSLFRWVVTAAHCVNKVDPLAVLAGANLTGVANERVEVPLENQFVHEEYDQNTSINDIGWYPNYINCLRSIQQTNNNKFI